jgi:hypothetical protein
VDVRRCVKWTDNVHAIALTLERLRLADLYGVTSRGEQYAGWKMLPGPITAGPGAAPTMSMEDAARFAAGLRASRRRPSLALSHRRVPLFRQSLRGVGPFMGWYDGTATENGGGQLDVVAAMTAVEREMYHAIGGHVPPRMAPATVAWHAPDRRWHLKRPKKGKTRPPKSRARHYACKVLPQHRHAA